MKQKNREFDAAIGAIEGIADFLNTSARQTSHDVFAPPRKLGVDGLYIDHEAFVHTTQPDHNQ